MCQSRKLARVPVLEWDHYTVRRERVEAVDRIGHEAGLSLLTISDYG